MKDLQKLVKECCDELDAIAVKYSNVQKWSVNTRAKKRWGQCARIAPDSFEISISAMLLADEVPDISAKQTIIHELLHTVDGCHDHQGKWKTYADYVNQRYPQYNIKRVSSYTEMGVTPPENRTASSAGPAVSGGGYVLRCLGCGEVMVRLRKSRVITYYKRYRCSKCGGRLERLK